METNTADDDYYFNQGWQDRLLIAIPVIIALCILLPNILGPYKVKKD